MCQSPDPVCQDIKQALLEVVDWLDCTRQPPKGFTVDDAFFVLKVVGELLTVWNAYKELVANRYSMGGNNA